LPSAALALRLPSVRRALLAADQLASEALLGPPGAADPPGP
jgi:hypothetical protein